MDEPSLPAGALRALPILPGLARMERPETPRLIQRWDAARWTFHALAPDLRTAYDGMFVPPRAGTGRHRRH